MNFEEIFKEFSPKVKRYLENLTGDPLDAEDLTQEVFIKINRALDKFEGKSSLSTWIYRIATNTANDRFRSAAFQKIRKNTQDGEFLEDDKEDKNVWSGKKEKHPDESLEKEEMNTCITRYIDDLNENYKTVLVLKDYEGMKNKEIADILDLTLDTVKIRLHRARTQLKKKMDQGCEVTPDEQSGLHCDEK